MSDAVSGKHNILLKDRYETFDYQIPIDEFINQLENGAVFDEVCVLGLGEALKSSESKNLARVLQERGEDLRFEGSAIQFAVEGSFQRVKGGFELKYDDELYRLDSIFGAQLQEHKEGWLVAPCQIS